MVRGREMFERALEFDTNSCSAMIGIAWSHIWDMTYAFSKDRDLSVKDALYAAKRAVNLDQTDSEAHHLLGIASLWASDHDTALSELERATNLNPNNSSAQVSFGNTLVLVGRSDDGIPHLERGFQLNPQHPRNHIWFTFMARAHLTARRYGEAVEWAKKAVQWRDDAPLPHIIEAACLGHIGNLSGARSALELCERIRSGYTAQPNKYWHPYKNVEDEEHVLDGLRKSGWNG